jgi:hypothetical protein
LIAAALIACGKGDKKAEDVPEVRDDAAVAIDAATKKVVDTRPTHIHTSVRCSECHGKMRDEWEGSSHSQAAVAPAYVAMKAQSVDGDACDECHAPLAIYSDAKASAVREGVTCDVCHTIQDVEMGPERASFTLAVHDMVRYGPLCDAKEHYFHRMGCSPLHQSAELCSSCHQLQITSPSGEAIPVFTTYSDWKAGPYAADDTPCQSCHMPGEVASVAEGEPERDGVPHHSFFGKERDLRQRAVTMTVTAKADGPKIAVTVTIDNSGAGHFVPSGLPARRLILRARTVGPNGDVDAVETVYGRILVDEGGREVPFYRAVRVQADTRIGPNKTAESTVQLNAPDSGELVVELVWRSIAHSVADVVSLPLSEVTDEVMSSASIRFGAVTAGGRGKLPKTVTVKK